MNTGMCLPTVRLSGPESEARSQGRTEAESYPQLVLGHKSVTFEKEADVVSHVSEVKGKKLFNLLSFTVEKSSLLIPSNFLLFLFSTCDQRNNEPFFSPPPPRRGLYVISSNAKGLVTHPAKQDMFKTDPQVHRQCDFIVLSVTVVSTGSHSQCHHRRSFCPQPCPLGPGWEGGSSW